jgi:hypothetical protein
MVFDHELIGVLDVVLEFLEGGSLADDPRYLTELAYIPVLILPVFKREFRGRCRHRVDLYFSSLVE